MGHSVADYNTCTSGFVLLGGNEVRTASVVLDVDDVTEEAIRRKFSSLVQTLNLFKMPSEAEEIMTAFLNEEMTSPT